MYSRKNGIWLNPLLLFIFMFVYKFGVFPLVLCRFCWSENRFSCYVTFLPFVLLVEANFVKTLRLLFYGLKLLLSSCVVEISSPFMRSGKISSEFSVICLVLFSYNYNFIFSTCIYWSLFNLSSCIFLSF